MRDYAVSDGGITLEMKSPFNGAGPKRTQPLAGRQGVEPRYAGPEPAVLPLNDLPAWVAAGVAGGKCYTRLTSPSNLEFRATILSMLPEVFECPACERQFVFELVDSSEDHSIHCPQCKRYLGEKDVSFILVSEIEELTERLRFERDRLEKDEAVYAMTEC